MAEATGLYGLIGSFKAASGKRDELIALLPNGCGDMAGCRSYIVARDAADPDLIWVSEVWDSKASHEASLALPSVRAAIVKGGSLIAGVGQRAETIPVAGVPAAHR